MIEKICSIYASEWHFITMMIPNISRELNQGKKIVTILQNDVQNKIEELLSKLNLKNKDKILEINWRDKTENIKIENLQLNKIENIDVIIEGTDEYIEEINNRIDNFYKTNKLNNNIKIINCYSSDNKNLSEIVKKYDKLLNTLGERNIKELINY